MILSNNLCPFVPSSDVSDAFSRNIQRSEGVPIKYQPMIEEASTNFNKQIEQDILNKRDFNFHACEEEFKKLGLQVYNDNLNKIWESAPNSRVARSKEARLIEAQKRNEGTLRLARKYQVKGFEQYSNELEANLRYGIENINKKLSKKSGISVKSPEEKANAMMKQLIEEENQIKRKKKNKTKTNNTRIKNKVKQQKKRTEACPTNHSEDETSITELDPVSVQQVKLSKFVVKLNSLKCLEHPRIQRWKTTDIESIRYFVDKNPEGEEIFRYQHLSNEEILTQRVRHFLPGTERVLKDRSYRSIYAFPTDRGFGVVGQLDYNQEKHNGVLYFGADKTRYIFHKYFENVDFKQTEKDLFQDEEEAVDGREKIEADGEWISAQDFQLEVSKEGVLHFTYPDHTIKIYPLRPELFQKKISQIGESV